MNDDEVIKFWELADVFQRSKEYHAQMRRGKWKQFRMLVLHHGELSQREGRRQRGGRYRAFYDNQNSGVLNQQDVRKYLRAKRDENNYEMWNEI